MNTSLEYGDEELWMELVKAYNSPNISVAERLAVRQSFLIKVVDRIATIKLHLVNDRFWWLALGLVEELTPEERIHLLPELIHRFFNSRLGDVDSIQTLLFSLPKELLITKIESLSEPYLTTQDEDDWLLILTLCKNVDANLMHRIAIKATESASAEIREIGNYFLMSEIGSISPTP